MKNFLKRRILIRSLNSFIFSFVAASLAFSITGCSETVSSDVDIDAYYVRYTVEKIDSTEAKAKAEFRVGGASGTYIELADGDKVRINDKEMILVDNIFSQNFYTANIPVKDSYTFTLTKGGIDYTDTGKMPGSTDVVSINGISNAPTLTKGDYVTVTWNNYVKNSKIKIEFDNNTSNNSSLSTYRLTWDNVYQKLDIDDPNFWRENTTTGSVEVRAKRIMILDVNPEFKDGFFELINSTGKKMDSTVVDPL